MLSISVSVSAAKLRRNRCSKRTLLVRTLVCNPDSVEISECGYRPGVKVLDDGVRDGKAAMATSDDQGMMCSESVLSTA